MLVPTTYQAHSVNKWKTYHLSKCKKSIYVRQEEKTWNSFFTYIKHQRSTSRQVMRGEKWCLAIRPPFYIFYIQLFILSFLGDHVNFSSVMKKCFFCWSVQWRSDIFEKHIWVMNVYPVTFTTNVPGEQGLLEVRSLEGSEKNI